MSTKSRIILVVAVILYMTNLVGTIIAETQYSGSGVGTTYNSGSDVASRTYDSGEDHAHYWLYVNLRAWGAQPNPLKDQRGADCYWCTSTTTVRVWGGYFGYYTARHIVKLHNAPGSSWNIYTSRSGAQSSYNCWIGSC